MPEGRRGTRSSIARLSLAGRRDERGRGTKGRCDASNGVERVRDEKGMAKGRRNSQFHPPTFASNSILTLTFVCKVNIDPVCGSGVLGK